MQGTVLKSMNHFLMQFNIAPTANKIIRELLIYSLISVHRSKRKNKSIIHLNRESQEIPMASTNFQQKKNVIAKHNAHTHSHVRRLNTVCIR